MKRLHFLLMSILVLCAIAAMVVGCSSGSNQNGQDPGDQNNEGNELPTGEAALEALLAMEDNMSLSGIQPLTLNSRAGIKKALPTEPKDNITIGWAAASLGSTFLKT